LIYIVFFFNLIGFQERSNLAIAKCEREGREVTFEAIKEYMPRGTASDIKPQQFFIIQAAHLFDKYLAKGFKIYQKSYRIFFKFYHDLINIFFNPYARAKSWNRRP
jgi:hypothetical protein